MGFWNNLITAFRGEKRGFGDYIPSSFGISASGINVDKNTALTFSAVWAAIRILSESVAQLPLFVNETNDDGDKKRRSDHKIYDLIHRQPNPYMTKNVFLQKIMYDLCVSGNSFVKINRNGGALPVELLPLDESQINLKVLDEVIFYEDRLAGEIYAAEDILHFKGITKDGYLGLSPIDVCANAIGWGMALEKYGNTYFNNGAKVSGVLQTDRALSTEAIDRLRQSFNENYSQVNDSNKTLILEEGLKFNTISLSNEASQFLASRQFSIEEIARIFNIPPHLLRDLSKSSFNNIQEQSREFVQYSLMPYISGIEAELNSKLFRNNEKGKLYVEFNVSALLRGNPKERADYYRTMVNIGAMTINEVRRKENLNSVEDGDNLFMQMNMTTVEKIVGGEVEAVDENIDVTLEATNGELN